MDANLYWYHGLENFSIRPQGTPGRAVSFSTLPESVELIPQYFAEWLRSCCDWHGRRKTPYELGQNRRQLETDEG
jgi:hypothetical protein